jgi:membrane protein
LRNLWPVLKEAARAWSADKAPQMGAALAYYTIFSLAPLLLIAIGVAGLVFGEEAARGEILQQIEGTVGRPTAEAVEAMLSNARADTGKGMTLVGLITLLFGASGVFIQLQDALNVIWKVHAKSSGVRGFVRDRLLSFLVVAGTGFLLLVSVVLSSLLAALNKYLTPSSLPGGVALWQGLHALVSLGIITLLFAMIYKVLPDARVAWRDVWAGAVLASLLFAVGKHLIGLYLGRSGVASTFGAAGSVVLVLVWVYYSSQILLFGAEVAHAYAVTCGSRGPKPGQAELNPHGAPEAAHAHSRG